MQSQTVTLGNFINCFLQSTSNGGGNIFEEIKYKIS